MKKEVLAVDVDEVLYPFVPTFLDFHNRMHGTTLTAADVKSYYFHDILGITSQAFRERIDAYELEDDEQIEPIEYAKAAIKSLSTRFDLVILTARHKRVAARTGKWIARHFADAFQDMYHVGYAPGESKRVSKAEICTQIGARALIDDSPVNLEGCVQVGVEGVMFGEYPWTLRSNLPAGIIHKANWPAVEEHFDVRD